MKMPLGVQYMVAVSLFKRKSLVLFNRVWGLFENVLPGWRKSHKYLSFYWLGVSQVTYNALTLSLSNDP
jgi:hypothetical protein